MVMQRRARPSFCTETKRCDPISTGATAIGRGYLRDTHICWQPTRWSQCSVLASMIRMGRDGYEKATYKILKTRQYIQDRIASEIPELYIMGDPKAMVVSWGSKSLNIYVLSDKLGKLDGQSTLCSDRRVPIYALRTDKLWTVSRSDLSTI